MNRRDEIIETASRLFARQGYHATSIRQIAAEVGCQGSAIYCHFEQGKQELLRTILAERMPDFEEFVGACTGASGTEKVFDTLAQQLAALARTHLQNWQWIAGEFPTLKPGERAVVRTRLSALHSGLAACLQAQVRDEAVARSTAWMLLALTAGYAQLVRLLPPDLDGHFASEQFISALNELLKPLAYRVEVTNVR
jgi:AcrR family transcriptional regulator